MDSKKDIKIYQLSSLSALPFWFPAFYNSYVQRGFILDKHPPVKLTAPIYFKSFGLTAIYQPLFPFVGVASKNLHQHLFGSSDNLLHRTLSLGIVSGSTALIVNPFEVWMLSIRSGLPIDSPVKYFRGTFPLALRNFIVGTNLFIAYPELKKAMNINDNSYVLGAASCIIPATITTLMLMPLDVTCAVLQKNVNVNKKEVWNQLKNSGFKTFFTGTKWRIVATTIETYLFNEFQEYYKKRI